MGCSRLAGARTCVLSLRGDTDMIEQDPQHGFNYKRLGLGPDDVGEGLAVNIILSFWMRCCFCPESESPGEDED